MNISVLHVATIFCKLMDGNFYIPVFFIDAIQRFCLFYSYRMSPAEQEETRQFYIEKARLQREEAAAKKLAAKEKQ